MPLSAPSPRQHLHTRTVTCKGYLREDGLWDIEGHMTDIKTCDIPNRDRGGRIAAGEPVHEMWLRITIDLEMRIHAAEACTDHAPYATCDRINDAYRKLVGLQIGPGWNRKLKALFGGIEGCTHLTELLGPMATTAFQTLYAARAKQGHERPRNGKPPLLNSCHTFSTHSPVTAREWPEYYEGPERTTPAEAPNDAAQAGDTRARAKSACGA